MARRSTATRDEVQIFNVVYQDGSLSSNRKIATAEIDAYNVDASIKAIIEAQDRDIAERSGRLRPPIKSITRASRK